MEILKLYNNSSLLILWLLQLIVYSCVSCWCTSWDDVLFKYIKGYVWIVCMEKSGHDIFNLFFFKFDEYFRVQGFIVQSISFGVKLPAERLCRGCPEFLCVYPSICRLLDFSVKDGISLRTSLLLISTNNHHEKYQIYDKHNKYSKIIL